VYGGCVWWCMVCCMVVYGVCMVCVWWCMVVYGGVCMVVCENNPPVERCTRTSNGSPQNVRFGVDPVYSCMVRGAGYTLKLFMSLEWTCFFFDTYLHSLLNTMSSLKGCRTFNRNRVI
jgi:hypothetical protein